MKRTHKLSIEQYGSPFYYDPLQNIKNLVNKEAELCYNREIKLPPYQKPPKPKITAGFINFFKQLKP